MYATYYNAEKRMRWLAIASLAVAIISSGGLVAVSLQHKVVPYAVEFNGHGEAVRVTRADEMEQPNSNQIRAALRDFVIQMRTIYAGDRRAQDNLIKAGYAKVLPNSPAFQFMTNFHHSNNPFDRGERESVEVEVNSVRSVSDKTYLIEWTETTRQISGQAIDKRIWHGSFTVAVIAPTEEAQIFVNPIGLYVDHASWGQRQ
jgi:type IV secretion system protein TrbF